MLGMQGEIETHDMSSCTKEVLALPPQVIQDRFHVVPGEGVTIELFGDSSAGMLGMGWIYTNRDTISIGIGVSLDDYIKSEITPYDMLQRLKAHPMVAPLVAGEGSTILEILYPLDDLSRLVCAAWSLPAARPRPDRPPRVRSRMRAWSAGR